MSHSLPDQSQNFIRNSVELLDAMASGNRLAILTLIVEREESVGKLSEQVGVTQSALSQHLTKLRSAGLVSSRREAQMVYYRCESPAVKRILAALRENFPPEMDQVADPAQRRGD